LDRYLGEADALIELSELATRYFRDAATQSGDAVAFVSAESTERGVRVNIAAFESWSHHLADTFVVVVYESAERFLHEFRKEHEALKSRPWSGVRDDIDPLSLALRNIRENQGEAEGETGRDLVDRFQYYRLVRNAIVHTKEPDLRRPRAKLKQLHDYSPQNQALLGSLEAPNPPGCLTFDDFVLFSHLTKMLAERICAMAEPAAEEFEKYVTKSFDLRPFRRLASGSERKRNAIAGCLQTEYGMEASRAQRLADEILTH
jgi:hypothetical protein